MQLVVTKRKEDEETSTTMYNAMDHMNPILNFKNYTSDNEDIIDQVCIAVSHTVRH